MPMPDSQVELAQLLDVELLLPRPYNVVRKLVDEAFMGIHRAPHVVAEIESASTLVAAIADGLGATILPVSAARVIGAACNARLCRIVNPVIEAPCPCVCRTTSPCPSPAWPSRKSSWSWSATSPPTTTSRADAVHHKTALLLRPIPSLRRAACGRTLAAGWTYRKSNS